MRDESRDGDVLNRSDGREWVSLRLRLPIKRDSRGLSYLSFLAMPEHSIPEVRLCLSLTSFRLRFTPHDGSNTRRGGLTLPLSVHWWNAHLECVSVKVVELDSIVDRVVFVCRVGVFQSGGLFMVCCQFRQFRLLLRELCSEWLES